MNYLKNRNPKYWFIGITVLAIFVLVLWAMGRVPWCECGYIKLWHGVVQSSENSQHFTDWYTPSHVLHGFLFYWILWLIGRKRRWPFGLLLVLAILLETSWEIFENTDFVINRYRTATISLDYYGDSIINSAVDVLAMILGFIAAYKLPVWTTVVLTIAVEAVVGYAIRDNLILNVIMLTYPLEFIKNWQIGG